MPKRISLANWTLGARPKIILYVYFEDVIGDWRLETRNNMILFHRYMLSKTIEPKHLSLSLQ